MRIVQSFIILALITTGCKDKQVRDQTSKKVDSTYLKMYPGIVPKLNKLVTTPSGNYFKFIQSHKKKCKIEWGNSQIKNISKDDYHFLICDSVKLERETDDFMILRSLITVQGWFFICLPLKQDKPELMIENPIIFDSKSNIVVSDGFRYDSVLLISNIYNGTIQPVIEKERCYSQMFHNCIDSISLSGKTLFYRFQVELDKSQMKKKYERKVEVRI
jgi:hypothetical protein